MQAWVPRACLTARAAVQCGQTAGFAAPGEIWRMRSYVSRTAPNADARWPPRVSSWFSIAIRASTERKPSRVVLLLMARGRKLPRPCGGTAAPSVKVSMMQQFAEWLCLKQTCPFHVDRRAILRVRRCGARGDRGRCRVGRGRSMVWQCKDGGGDERVMHDAPWLLLQTCFTAAQQT